ncbi:hypothetical protein I4U23_016058 [Adineta vaga]|nr:hypothetical protein I4U23_016058 [Adineta vaga]
MGRNSPDTPSQILGFVAFAFGLIALLLVCIGIGTQYWYATGNTSYITTSANFFSLCTYDSTNGNRISCTSRSGDTHPFCTLAYSGTTVTSSLSDCNNRLRNASGLGIIGIILLLFGVVTTLLMAIGLLTVAFLNFLPGILLFLACLFMLAALAEGSRYMPYNNYSANLYQTGHLFTMFALFLSAAAGGRISFARNNPR